MSGQRGAAYRAMARPTPAVGSGNYRLCGTIPVRSGRVVREARDAGELRDRHEPAVRVAEGPGWTDVPSVMAQEISVIGLARAYPID